MTRMQNENPGGASLSLISVLLDLGEKKGGGEEGGWSGAFEDFYLQELRSRPRVV